MKQFYYFAIILIFITNAYSQQNDDASNKGTCSKWNFEFSAGAWNSGMVGDLTANSLPGYIKLTVGDKFEGPDFSYFAEFEARKNKLILIAQFTSINQTGNGTFVNSPYSVSHSTARPLFVTAGLSFEFYKNESLDVQLFGGARWNYIRNQIATDMVSGGTRKEEENRGFIDPLAGARFQYKPFKCGVPGNLYLKGYFDLGGFGLVSFLTFQSYLSAGYEFNENFSLRLGYRYLDVHYGSGNYLYDAGIQGFEFAATTRF